MYNLLKTIVFFQLNHRNVSLIPSQSFPGESHSFFSPLAFKKEQPLALALYITTKFAPQNCAIKSLYVPLRTNI